MIEEWDKLWKEPWASYTKYCTTEYDEYETWINQVNNVGDKLRERVEYLEGLTQGDIDLITRLQVENKQLRRDTKDLAELGSDDLKKRVAYQKENEALKIVTAKLFNKLSDEQQKLEALRGELRFFESLEVNLEEFKAKDIVKHFRKVLGDE